MRGFCEDGEVLQSFEKRSGHDKKNKRGGEDGNSRNDGPQETVEEIAYKGGGDDNGTRGDLAEGNAIHEGFLVHQASDIDHLMKHKGD